MKCENCTNALITAMDLHFGVCGPCRRAEKDTRKRELYRSLTSDAIRGRRPKNTCSICGTTTSSVVAKLCPDCLAQQRKPISKPLAASAGAEKRTCDCGGFLITPKDKLSGLCPYCRREFKKLGSQPPLKAEAAQCVCGNLLLTKTEKFRGSCSPCKKSNMRSEKVPRRAKSTPGVCIACGAATRDLRYKYCSSCGERCNVCTKIIRYNQEILRKTCNKCHKKIELMRLPE